MKKFISALSSFVIAATAMSGTFAFSTDAATEPSETIFAFRSGENKADTVQTQAGKSVPVSLYIPQSNGFNQFALKFTINGKETLGKGSLKKSNAEDAEVVENYKYAFSNYGIECMADADLDGVADEGYPRPCCLESGWVSGSKKYAGYAKTGGMTNFTDYAMNISYIANGAITRKSGAVDMDAYGAWVAEGSPTDYDTYTPVTKWSEDVAWAYDYSFANFMLKLPADLPDGKYVLDVYTDEYYICTPTAIFDTDGNEIPDEKKTTGKSGVSGVDPSDTTKSIAKNFSSKPLTIIVGDGPVDTDPTTTTATTPKDNPTTTTTTPKSVSTEGKIIYNLVPNGKEYTAAADGAEANNVYNATAGEELTINWNVKNDGGTAGIQMFFDFSQVEYIKGIDDGEAYMVEPTINDKDANTTTGETAGVVAYNFGGATQYKAADDQTIYSFKIKVPEANGKYTIDLKKGNADLVNKVIPKDQTKPYEFIFHGLDIVVGDPGTDPTGTTTTTVSTPKDNPSTTTTTPKTVSTDGKIIYNLIPSGKDYTAAADGAEANNVYNATAGEDLTINWTVKQDGGTAGIQMFFDFSQVEYVKGIDDGEAYMVEPTLNDKDANTTTGETAGVVAYNFGGATQYQAQDGQTIYSFKIKVPETKGTYTIGLKTGNADLVNKVIPKDQTKPYEFIFHGLDIVVGGPTDTTTTVTTTSTTVTTTTTSDTDPGTTTTTTTTITTTTTTSTTPEQKNELLWGDANCDGKVKIADVVLINRSLAGTATLSDQGKANADVVYDGTVDMKDVDKIKEFLAWLIPHSELGDQVRSSGLGYVNELGW